MKILVVAAHPDDEVLGCGGTIARLNREGHEIAIAILGEGVTSRYEQREKADPALIKALHGKAGEVAKLLGAKQLTLHSLPDNRFDTVPLLEVVKVVEDLIAGSKPEAIYTHHGGDLNIDHVITHRAVLTASRPMKGHPVREVYAFEVASSTEWAFQRFEPAFRPSVFVDISAGGVEVKQRAMALYETEARAFPHPRSPEALAAIARRWGSVAGCEAAEAFELVRSLR